MAEGDDLLRAVIAAPDDDAPRLVYADWLDEHGQPDRAEFIRLQCQLESLPPGGEGRPALEGREKALLKQYAKQWAEPFGAFIRHWRYRRGFIDTVEIPIFIRGDGYVRELRRVARRTPLRGLLVEEQFADFAKLRTAAPAMRRLRDLLIRNGDLHSGGRHLRALLNGPHVGQLRKLDLFGSPYYMASWFRTGTLVAILKSPGLKRLEDLSLEDSRRSLDPAALRALAESPFAGRLRRLSLLGTRVGAGVVRALGRSLGRLEVLELRRGRFDAAAWRALLDSAAFPSLQRLGLGGASVEGVSLTDKTASGRRREARARYGAAVDFSSKGDPPPVFHAWWHR